MRKKIHHGTPLAAALIALAALAASSTVAQAQCPRGQILWKSKNSCVDKAEAAKLGFYHGPIPKTEAPADAGAPGPDAASQPPAAQEPAPAAEPNAAPDSRSAHKPATEKKSAARPATNSAPKPAAPDKAETFAAPLAPPPAFAPPAFAPATSAPPGSAPSGAAPAAGAKSSPYGELVIQDFSHGK